MRRITTFAIVTIILISMCSSCLNIQYHQFLSTDNDYDIENPVCDVDSEGIGIIFGKNDEHIPINESKLYQTNYFSTYYFSNLTANYGSNDVGSCSYVALAMLLSYYDTYWNDSLIEERYDQSSDTINKKISDVESPGIKNDGNLYISRLKELGVQELSHSEYYQLVTANSDEYFQYKLIEMGRVKNIYKLYEFFDLNPYGLSGNGRNKLLETYLYDYMNLDKDIISYEYVTSDVEEYVIEKVSAGIPVLIAVGWSDGQGHALIAYDYDKISGKIYAHMGWGPDKTHIDLSSLEYSRIKNALTLNINFSHSHSNNYIDQTTGNSYCSCYFPCHPEHKCTYTYDDDSHTYSCGCKYEKYIISSEHEYEYKTTGDKCHILTCTTCGKTSGAESGHILKASTSTDKYAMCSVCGAWVYKGGNTIFPTQPYKKEWELEMVEAHQKY